MSAASAKALFRATRPSPVAGVPLIADLPRQDAPADARDPLDYDPTPPDATAAFLGAEMDAILAHGRRVWEPAVGAGHIARVLAQHGFEVIGNDVQDRGWPGVILRSFFAVHEALAPIQITNPPYGQISARDGHGRWLTHALALQPGYLAMLLNADWPAARINGFDALFAKHPPSVEYLCCWKIDFRGGGSPPQRNSWFVWDTNRPAPGPNTWLRKRLYRDAPDARQGVLV
ncbi:hypothetical protein [Pararhodobacter zhoushanensis]|uniref:SAM-dependent methyltransferase n=1 Tax=Pararhodobacter zhoushanensis TaxID=2479545 RepID=A0ABT3GYL9_9RHOB|nr:hypothetical protein [Pararhodobacter zhoushanensis]MCW1932629.1 hypothetical protein [Pararhodobacter zhoushanensis]